MFCRAGRTISNGAFCRRDCTEKCAGSDSSWVFCSANPGSRPLGPRQANSCNRSRRFRSGCARRSWYPDRASRKSGSARKARKPSLIACSSGWCRRRLRTSPRARAVSPARRRAVSAGGDCARLHAERAASRANAATRIPRAGRLAGRARLCRAGAGTPRPRRHRWTLSGGPGRLRRSRLSRSGRATADAIAAVADRSCRRQCGDGGRCRTRRRTRGSAGCGDPEPPTRGRGRDPRAWRQARPRPGRQDPHVASPLDRCDGDDLQDRQVEPRAGARRGWPRAYGRPGHSPPARPGCSSAAVPTRTSRRSAAVARLAEEFPRPFHKLRARAPSRCVATTLPRSPATITTPFVRLQPKAAILNAAPSAARRLVQVGLFDRRETNGLAIRRRTTSLALLETDDRLANLAPDLSLRNTSRVVAVRFGWDQALMDVLP